MKLRRAAAACAGTFALLTAILERADVAPRPLTGEPSSSKLRLARALAQCAEPQRCSSIERRSPRLRAWFSATDEGVPKLLKWRHLPLPPIVPTFLNATQPSRCPAIDRPFEAQLTVVIREILERTATNEVAFTIIDKSYGDMLDQNFRMALRAGFGAQMFYVSLDRATAEDACLRKKLVAFLAKPPSSGTKDQVHLGKYYTALLLCRARVNFFFWEMDLWLPPRPLNSLSVVDVFRAAAASDNAGLHAGSAWALHEDNPYTINIGLYYISDTDERAYDLFEVVLDYLRRHPHAFDQGLVNCLLKKISSHQRINYLRDRDNCRVDGFEVDGKGHLLDSALSSLIIKARPGRSSGEGNYNFTLVDGVVAASYALPFLFRDTLAVHVLSSVPLSSAMGKKVVAKELMLWEDDEDYFTLQRGRFLALHGALAPASGADDFGALRARLLELCALARQLNRILILPPAWHLARRLQAWELLELKSLEEAGVAWREATLLENPRLRVGADATFVALGLTGKGAVVRGAEGGAISYDARFNGDSRAAQLRFLVHVGTGDRRCRDAAVLFVGLDANRGRAVPPLRTPALSRDLPVASEAWLALPLTVCAYKHREKRRVALVGAAFECGGQLATARKLRKPKPPHTTHDASGGMTSVPGRRAMADAFMNALGPFVARAAPPVAHHVAFGPYPDAFARAYGFWEPGHKT